MAISVLRSGHGLIAAMMTAMRTLLTFVLVLAAMPAVEVPKLPPGAIEYAGTLRNHPFWVRISAPRPDLSGKRLAELVYEPPAPETLAGAHLSDVPFLLLDDEARVVSWRDRTTLSEVRRDATAYRVTRELRQKQDDADAIQSDDARIASALAWDERLMPVLLAACWSASSSAQVPCTDLFMPGAVESALTWQDATVRLAGRSYRVVADAQGRLSQLLDAADQPLIRVTTRIIP